jgi:hypothetical protein
VAVSEAALRGGACDNIGRMSQPEKREVQPVKLGPIATRVVYEDERVRVWDQLIEPGATTGPHHHTLPYALVTVEGSSLDVFPVPGHPTIHGEETLSVDIESRTAGVLSEGSVEEAINTGNRPYRAILVEFKNCDET